MAAAKPSNDFFVSVGLVQPWCDAGAHQQPPDGPWRGCSTWVIPDGQQRGLLTFADSRLPGLVHPLGGNRYHLGALSQARSVGRCCSTSRRSRATNATPPAARMRSRNATCSGLVRPVLLFTSTAKNRPSRNCPSTSGHPGQPNRTKRPPTRTAPLFCLSAHATAGCVRSAFKISTSAAASGRSLVRLGCWISCPSKSVSGVCFGAGTKGTPLKGVVPICTFLPVGTVGYVYLFVPCTPLTLQPQQYKPYRQPHARRRRLPMLSWRDTPRHGVESKPDAVALGAQVTLFRDFCASALG